MGCLILPAIFLMTKGFIFYGIALIIIYLAFETFRTGVEFDFDEAKLKGFKEVFFFIKTRQSNSTDLSEFSHYRLRQGHNETSVSANWAQQSTISQTHQTLELYHKQEGYFQQVVKSDYDQLQPLLEKLEEQHITLAQ